METCGTRQLALDTDGTVQELLQEALNDLFLKHSRPPIAKRERRRKPSTSFVQRIDASVDTGMLG
jgi:hypothetical protein